MGHLVSLCLLVSSLLVGIVVGKSFELAHQYDYAHFNFAETCRQQRFNC